MSDLLMHVLFVNEDSFLYLEPSVLEFGQNEVVSAHTYRFQPWLKLMSCSGGCYFYMRATSFENPQYTIEFSEILRWRDEKYSASQWVYLIHLFTSLGSFLTTSSQCPSPHHIWWSVQLCYHLNGYSIFQLPGSFDPLKIRSVSLFRLR